MPVTLTKLKSGKIKVSTPGGIKAHAASLTKAKAQKRLLQAIEHDPTFVPRKQKAANRFKTFQKGFREATSNLGIRRKKK